MNNENYVLSEILGKSIISTVVKASKGNGLAVALKVVENDTFDNAKKEAAFYGKLEHPNIIPIIEYTEILFDGELRPALVFPIFYSTLDSEDLILSLSEINLAMKQLIDVTEFIHSKLMTHNDLHLGNISINNFKDDGFIYIRVFDFSLSSEFEDTSSWKKNTFNDFRSLLRILLLLTLKFLYEGNLPNGIQYLKSKYEWDILKTLEVPPQYTDLIDKLEDAYFSAKVLDRNILESFLKILRQIDLTNSARKL